MTFLLDQRYFWGLTVCLGIITAIFSGLGTRRAFRDLELPVGLNFGKSVSRGMGSWPVLAAICGGLLGGAFVYCSLKLGTQSTPEVIPGEVQGFLRVLFHLSLIVLLVIVSATDLKSFYILDWCCWTGFLIGVIGATASGHFQLAHVWVDWNAEIPQIRGPDIPAWLSLAPHWHGLAWSLAGATLGFVVTAISRWVAEFVLQTPALGFGDVLLMAMVGAYLGWQPTLVALMIAPICAIGIGSLLRLTGNRPALPYGPFLAAGSLITLFFWKRIWMAEWVFSSSGVDDRSTTFAVRRFFGDPISLGLVFGCSLVVFVTLLTLLRIYKMLPIKLQHRSGSSS